MLKSEDFATAVASHRPFLLKLAVNQLGDKDLAEDAVQETLLAALAGAARFEQRASLKTWLLSILKYKIIDAIRGKSRMSTLVSPATSMDEDRTDDPFEALFDAAGCWAEPKDVWTDPEIVAERTAFFKVLEACLTRLPERTSQTFLMREWLESEPAEICAVLGLTQGNLRVLLYRARMQLRHCLELNWER